MSIDEFEKLNTRILSESPIRWSELTKLDSFDRLILIAWKSMNFPGSMDVWIDFLIRSYLKTKGLPLYKRKLYWQVFHFRKVMKSHIRKNRLRQATLMAEKK